ncbi:MAG: cyclic nucleotide-binding domain-containing protein [Candidatus Firestonebacteria bacterium]
MADKLELLKSISIFAALTSEDLKIIANITKEEHFDSGATIFKEGDSGGKLYFVVKGTIKIYRDGIGEQRKILASLVANEVFGEISIFDDLPRSASAVTYESCDLLSISAPELNKLLAYNTGLAVRLLRELVKNLSKRLRATNDHIQDYVLWGLTSKL